MSGEQEAVVPAWLVPGAVLRFGRPDQSWISTRYHVRAVGDASVEAEMRSGTKCGDIVRIPLQEVLAHLVNADPHRSDAEHAELTRIEDKLVEIDGRKTTCARDIERLRIRWEALCAEGDRLRARRHELTGGSTR